MIEADDIAKIFGNQDNFNMLKGLLNQTMTSVERGKPPPAFVKTKDANSRTQNNFTNPN